MRKARNKRQCSSKQDWQAEMTRAVAAFCIVLLLAPALTDASQIHSRKLPARQPSRRGVRQPAAWCMRQIAGCTVCYQETPGAAPNAQFPGATEVQGNSLETVVRCMRCQNGTYVYNKDNQNCDCAAGHGTAFPNGTAITVDSFTQPVYNKQYSDSMDFGSEYTNSTNNSTNSSSFGNSNMTGNSSVASDGSVVGSNSTINSTSTDMPTATTNTFAQAVSSLNERAVVREMALDRKRQPAQRLRFQRYMRARGYDVRSSRQATYVSERPVAGTFSSVVVDDKQPTGTTSTPESPLRCVACRGNSVSIGGLIGGSFCMPCGAGTTPDHATGTCKSLN